MRVLVVTSGWPSPLHPEQSIFVAEHVDRLRELGLDVDVVTYLGEFDPRNYVRGRRDVRRALRERPPDLIHAHFGQSGIIVLPSRVPVVLQLHGSDLLGVVRHGRYTVKGWILRRISRWAARRADRVIVAGRALIPRLPNGVDYDILPMGVNTDVFYPRPKAQMRGELGLALDRRYVMFTGDPAVARKRYNLATQVIDRLRRSMDIELLHMSGQSRESVARHLNACDALLCTSLHESGPVLVKEALACGVPVVSVDVGDVAEMIAGLDSCVLCHDDQVSTLADGLRDVLEHVAPADVTAAVARVDQRVLAMRQVEIYEETLRRSRQGT